MGLFGGKKKVKAFTAVQRIVSDENIILSSEVGMMKYLIESAGRTSVSLKDKTLPDYLIEASESSVYRRYKQARSYAEAGNYAYGLPTAGDITTKGVDIHPAVKAEIEAIEGHSVDLVYAFIGDANYQHFLWKKLIEVYGYNPTTNELVELSTSVGFPCFLKTAKLVYGTATIQIDETGDSLDQYGFSTENGECLTRTRDLARLPVAPDADTDVDDAYVEMTYEYIEIIPDTTAPVAPTVNSLSITAVDGYAEKDSTVSIYVNTVLNGTVTAATDGYFTYTFPTAITTGDTVDVTSTDSAINTSSPTTALVPYTNPTPATVGTDKTITEVTHTIDVTFDLLDYIPSAVEIIPAEPDDTPVTVPGDDTYVPEYDYIQACYTYDVSGVTHIGYFTYAYGSGDNETLDDLFSGAAAFGEFYPRLYARLNAQDLPNTLSTASAEYKSSKRLAKILGLDWKDWSDNLQSSIEDIGDVQQLLLTLAVPMNTTDPVLLEYQYRYWSAMHAVCTTPITGDAYDGMDARVGKAVEVKDTVYSHFVTFDAISTKDVTGSIGAVGSYNTEYVNQHIEYVAATYPPGAGRITYGRLTWVRIPPHHIYRCQIDADTYRELRVYNVGSTQSFSGVTTTAIAQDETLIIPLDRTVLPVMTNKEAEILFSKSFYLLVNIRKVIKIKWYQRGAFQVVLVVAAIVITVISSGAAMPLSQAIITAVLTAVAIQAVIRILIKLGVSAKLAMALAIIAALATGYLDLSNTTSICNLTAMQFMQISSVAFQMAAKINEYQLKEIMKDQEEFQREAGIKAEELKQAKELLGERPMNLTLDLLLTDARSQVFIKFGETPEMFLNNSPVSIMDMSKSFTSDFVEINRTPPSLSQMLSKSRRGDDNGIEI